MTNKFEMSRRGLLRGSTGLAGLSLMTGGTTATIFEALMSRPARAADLNYGPLAPVVDETSGLPLLQLPEGFRYQTYGWRNDPMRDGSPTPPNHDGMGVVRATGSNLVLVRNHERGNPSPSFAKPHNTYDPNANGGTTNLMFNTKAGKFTSSWASLGGTVRNCAGGPTPWGSWLSCEETTLGAPDFEREHGWVFEVPANGNSTAVPLKGLGRFNHEAAAVDPATGYVYETEDGNPSGFYRYVAAEFGNLAAGGQLQMLKVKNATSATDLRGKGQATGGRQFGETYDVEWVTIDDPERAHVPGTTNERGVVQQGLDQFGPYSRAVKDFGTTAARCSSRARMADRSIKVRSGSTRRRRRS
jgi:secreted PhoX family phosphatase